MARDLVAGATSYARQPLSEIVKDFREMADESKEILKLEGVLKYKTLPIDVAGAFGGVFMLAKRVRETHKKRGGEVAKERPSEILIGELVSLGVEAHRHGNLLGETWHKQDWSITDNQRIANAYSDLRDYCYGIIDLSNIGHELKARYYLDGKPAFKSVKSLWDYFIDLVGALKPW